MAQLGEEQKIKARAACAKWRAANGEKARALCTAWREKNREASREASRRWMQVNKERVLANAKIYWAANKDKKKAKDARCWAKNKDKYNAMSRTWRANNKEKVRAGFLRWYASNMEVVRAHNATRRALKRGAEGSHTAKEWLQALEYYGRMCAYCLIPVEAPQKEHVVALINGGSNYIENLVPSCPSCNARKGAKTLVQFLSL